MTDQVSIARYIEMQMIRSDANFYYDLINCVLPSKQAGIIMPCLIPFLSLFAIETYIYFGKTYPEYSRELTLDYEDVLRAARTKIKLFEEDNIVNILESIAKHQKAEFIDSHTGNLAWLKKLLQPDLGLYYYDGYMICTTHLMHSYIAHERNSRSSTDLSLNRDVSGQSFSIGHELGKYIGSLYEAFSLGNTGIDKLCKQNIDDGLVQSKDVKFDRYVRAIFNGPVLVDINACLLAFLCLFNTVNSIVQQLAHVGSESLFKVKYITLYQLWTSLRKLRNFYYPKGVLTEQSKQTLTAILKNDELEALLSQPRFRNILIHYDLSSAKFPENNLDPNIRLWGLTEYYFKGSSMGELSILLDRQMNRVSALLEGWLINA